MNGSHIAGTGTGGILAVVLVALGHRIGLDVSTIDAAGLALALATIGLGAGHALGRAWSGPGVFPALRRGLFGPRVVSDTLPPIPPTPAPQPPVSSTEVTTVG